MALAHRQRIEHVEIGRTQQADETTPPCSCRRALIAVLPPTEGHLRRSVVVSARTAPRFNNPPQVR
jgi:hypothetical protein